MEVVGGLPAPYGPEWILRKIPSKVLELQPTTGRVIVYRALLAIRTSPKSSRLSVSLKTVYAGSIRPGMQVDINPQLGTNYPSRFALNNTAVPRN